MTNNDIVDKKIFFLSYFAIYYLKAKLGYDDALDVWGIHGMSGVWGAIATGIFAVPAVNGAAGLIAGNAYKEQGQLQGILLANAEKLSAEEQKQVQYLMDQHSSLVSQVVKSGEALEIEQQKTKLLERRMIAEAQLAAGERSNHKVSGVEVHRKSLEGITELYYKISSISLTGNMEKDAQSFQRLNKIIAELKGNTVQLGKEGQLAVNQLANGLKNGTLTAKDLDNILLQLEKQQVISMNGLITALEKCGIEDLRKKIM